MLKLHSELQSWKFQKAGMCESPRVSKAWAEASQPPQKVTSALHGVGHVEKRQQLKTGASMKWVTALSLDAATRAFLVVSDP